MDYFSIAIVDYFSIGIYIVGLLFGGDRQGTREGNLNK